VQAHPIASWSKARNPPSREGGGQSPCWMRSIMAETPCRPDEERRARINEKIRQAQERVRNALALMRFASEDPDREDLHPVFGGKTQPYRTEISPAFSFPQPFTEHLARRTSHGARRTSHAVHVARRTLCTSHVARCARRTSHVARCARSTLHVARSTCRLTC
jgi:hypothetical protein